MNIFKRIWTKIVVVLNRQYYKSNLKKFGRNSYIIRPLKMAGHEYITVHENVIIAHYSWLMAIPLNKEKGCRLEIGKGSNIGHYNHICATESVIIEDDVLTADKVYISDNLHTYEDINVPIRLQPIKQIATVVIGSGSWLGESACVIGAKIGKNCVVGSNAVVTKDVPDYCVVVGAPAKIIKRYCLQTRQWKKTTADGKFID